MTETNREARAYEWIRTLTESPARFDGSGLERGVAEQVGHWLHELGGRDVALEPVPGAPRSGYVLALHAGGTLLGLWLGGASSGRSWRSCRCGRSAATCAAVSSDCRACCRHRSRSTSSPASAPPRRCGGWC